MIFLRDSGLSGNTIVSYSGSVKSYIDRCGSFSFSGLMSYKSYLIDNYSPRSVNLKIQAINRYLEFSGNDKLKLKFVRVHESKQLENVISDSEYRKFKKHLLDDGHVKWYFMIWTMAATGARISELLKIRVEDLVKGAADIYTKGGKIRRLYIPDNLCAELLSWLRTQNIERGFIFLNRFGNRISPRGVSFQLKHFALLYGIDPKVVYPHSFRHRFAKNFLNKYHDIALLADLMGHENIETTRIYLRKTSCEQRTVVNSVIDW